MITGEAFGVDWYNSNWSYRRQITIDHTKVEDVADPSATYADFPLLVYAAGLSNINANGTDIRFTASDGVSELPREIESYSGGILYAWVKVTLTKDASDSTDDVIYMYHGNPSAIEPPSSSTYGSENVWDSNYVMVQHLQETSGTHQDSTTYNNDAIPQNFGSGDATQNATGKIAGADNFDGADTTGAYLDLANAGNSLQMGTGAWTASAWISTTSAPAYSSIVVFDETGIVFEFNQPVLLVNDVSTNWGDTKVFNLGTWVYVVATKTSGTPGTQFIYEDGVDHTEAYSSSNWLIDNQYWISRAYQGAMFDGIIDEVRISNIARSADWMKTSYNNQNSPSTFYSVGSEDNDFTWDGSASSDWGNPANWDVNAVPGTGHTVIIPDVANAPVLDTARAVAVLTINGETLDLNGNSLTISGDLTVNGSGILDASTGTPTITVGGIWDVSGGTFMPGAGTARFNGTGAHSITSGVSSFYNLVFDNAGGTWTLQDALDVDNDLTITAGTLDTNGNNINVAGDWTNNGTFTAGTGTVTLNGTGTQDIWSGGSAFNTLEITNSTSDVTFLDDLTATNFTSNTGSVAMRFTAGSTYIITNLTLNGTQGNRITLRSTVPGTQWVLNVSGTQSLSYVDVSDSDASGGSQIICTTGCTGAGSNNDNWIIQLVSIPTMTEWGMIIFMVLTGLISFYRLRKKRINP